MKRFHVYKVVREYDDGKALASAIVDPSIQYCINYYPGKYAKPEVGKIFAFSQLYLAENFAHELSNCEVWECLTTKRPVEHKMLFLSFQHINLGYTTYSNGREDLLKEFWKRFPSILTSPREYHGDQFSFDNNTFSLMSVPEGTVLCDDLKLWKQIQ